VKKRKKRTDRARHNADSWHIAGPKTASEIGPRPPAFAEPKTNPPPRERHPEQSK